ncbi:acetyl esterase [Tistlia consotensis]|uniref:Acetyl esterase n=1 Tax=Tistlia consotensis USBA 355 TaxID=560819 RepID=A0A1Y6BCG8_9PROT|nr:alpha/beta hydrolase fold domain-containing protein [Tistlia consotensis]SMF03845.1 acetyl esterase [Tistlia consotensis USBA 355]SNR54095.1 acetyl esterase [Tistlia consotensis]
MAEGRPATARDEPALRLDPQMLAAGRRYLEAAPDLRTLDELPVETARARTRAARAPWNEGGPVMASVEEAELPGPRRPVPIRILRPAAGAQAPVTLFFHGGGFVLGDLDSHDRVMRELAAATGGPVVGVDYALGPERRFPAAFEEAAAAVVALAGEGGRLGLDGRRLVLAGESAGARLALSACLDPAARATGAPAACLLYYGSFGLRDSASRRLYAGGAFGLGERQLAFFRRHHLGPDGNPDDPRLDPLAGDLSGLPPLFLAAAELDPLRDDSLALHWQIRAAGGRSRLSLARGLPHGYLLFTPSVEAAAASLAEGAAFALACLAD